MKYPDGTYVDDLGGLGRAEPVAFTYQRITYVVDLNDENLAEFERVLDPYMHAATRVRAPKTPQGQKGPSEAGAIRAWGKRHGYDVGDHGRLPAALLRDYKAAYHQTKKEAATS